MTVTVVSGRTQEDTLPIGSIIGWHNTTSVPNGWLVCNGSLQPIATYPSLYKVITNDGTTFPFGPNVGSSFVLPLLTGRFMSVPSTVTPPTGANSNVGITNAATAHTHNYTINHSINSSGSANHGLHNVQSGGWSTTDGGGHNMQTNIGAVGGNVTAGANGTLNTAFRGHLHNANQGNQTTTGHSHAHGFATGFDNAVASGSLHTHNFSITASSNVSWSNTPFVRDAPCVFIVLALISDFVGRR